jgi:hypothetical protein
MSPGQDAVVVITLANRESPQAAYPSTVSVPALAIINEVEPGQLMEAGRKAKRVVGGELP